MAVSPDQFVREFLTVRCEQGFVNGSLTYDEYSRGVAELLAVDLTHFANQLFSRSPSELAMPGGDIIRLIHLREVDGTEFPFLLALPKRPPVTKRLSCFVGHRFLKEIEDTLRFNLAHVLDPYQIELRWAGQDLSASDLFAEIVAGIRGASMCFFDNRLAEHKPNVYIEVGIAYALGVPTILAEHVDAAEPRTAASSIPSDLQGLFRIQYTTYEELFRKLYFGLPSFDAKISHDS